MTKMIFGIGLFIGGVVLAVYNVKKHERNEISGPTLSLIFSSLIGLALIFNVPFKIGGFDSQALDEKVKKAEESKNQAVVARKKAEEALKESQKIYALSLIRTGMLPSEESVKKNTVEAKKIFKELYKDNYNVEVKSMIDSGLIPSNVELLDLDNK